MPGGPIKKGTGMKTIGVLVLVIGVLVAIGGVGYGSFLMSEQSRRSYLCGRVEPSRAEVEKAAEAYKAAKGTPQEKDAEKKLKQLSENELTAIRGCAEEKSFYRTWIAAGFSVAAGGLLSSIIGLGIFLFGRQRLKTQRLE
jgi:hypothetical protein